MQDHGTLCFELKDNILLIEGCGPWNKEAMLLSSKSAQLAQKQRTKEKWGVIAIINGEPVHTPDAAELLIEYVRNDKKDGRVATGLILTGSSFPELGKRHIAKLYNKAGEQFQFFNNIADAEVWVRSLL